MNRNWDNCGSGRSKKYGFMYFTYRKTGALLGLFLPVREVRDEQPHPLHLCVR